MNAPARSEIAVIAGTLQSPEYKTQIAQAMGVKPGDPLVDRFIRVAMRAVQEDPKLLNADRASLYLACQAAAIDGLMPDGREGKLVTYNTKQGNVWIEKVQWQRMIGGLRKLSVRGDFDLLAECVYSNDLFRQRKGSNPGIDHEPATLGTSRGDLIGAYAVATNLKTGKQYFECMSKDEIDKVSRHSKSKDRDGNLVGPWRDWYDEQARKTVSKRLFKSLPIDNEKAEQLYAVIGRDNDEYEALPNPQNSSAPTLSKPDKPRALAAVINAVPEAVVEEPEAVTVEPFVAASATPIAEAVSAADAVLLSVALSRAPVEEPSDRPAASPLF